MWIQVYQDEYLASIRIFADKVEADETRLKFFHKGDFIGSAYFDHHQDCHHIEISENIKTVHEFGI